MEVLREVDVQIMEFMNHVDSSNQLVDGLGGKCDELYHKSINEFTTQVHKFSPSKAINPKIVDEKVG
jgi:hypothetical protein